MFTAKIKMDTYEMKSMGSAGVEDRHTYDHRPKNTRTEVRVSAVVVPRSHHSADELNRDSLASLKCSSLRSVT